RGVETYVHELSNRLVKMGHEVVVYQNGPKVPGARYKTKTIGMDVDLLRKRMDLLRKRRYMPFLDYHMRKLAVFSFKVLKDLDKETDILLPTNGQWQSLFCSIWGKLNKTKVVILGHSGLGMDDRINLWTFPDIFLGLTNHQTKWAKRVNPLVKSKKITIGVDTSKFSEKIKPIKIDLPKPIVLGVGAFDSWKRWDLAIKAVSKMKKGSLLLVGRGNEEKRYKNMARELLPGRFSIMHFPYKDMPRVYAAADVFTYPTSSQESFGIVTIEAMASGLPMVVNNDPIRKEIIGNAGILVDPIDTEKYAKVIKEALDKDWENKPRKGEFRP
ncbi:unnamed protein product, partial [marine sediment metagenome]